MRCSTSQAYSAAESGASQAIPRSSHSFSSRSSGCSGATCTVAGSTATCTGVDLAANTPVTLSLAVAVDALARRSRASHGSA